MSKLQVNDIVNKDDTGSVGFSKGVIVTGISTFNNTVNLGSVCSISTSGNSLSINSNDSVSISGYYGGTKLLSQQGSNLVVADAVGGDVELYYVTSSGPNGSEKRLETTAGGIAVVGIVTATSFSGTVPSSNLSGALPAIDGSALTGIQFGVRDFVGFGTINARDPVGIRSDGTVGVITSTGSQTSVGTEVQYESGASFDQASVYSTPDNKTVLIYRDHGDSGHGKSVVATVSGEVISFGSVVGFSTGETRGTSIAYDPDTDRVIAHYIDYDWGNMPVWCVGEMQGNGTISWGTPSSHYGNSTTGMTDCVYDTQNDKIVLIWGNTQGGELKTFAGNVNTNNTLSLGGSQEIGDSNNTPDKLTALWHAANSRVVVFFEDIDDSNKGFYSIGVYNTNNQYTWTSPTQFTTGPIDVMKSVYDSTNDRIIFAYRDTGNSNYGTARVGSLSGNTITWGNDVVFNSADTEEISMDWDSVGERVVIGYKDAGNSDKGMFVTGTISGANKRTITFGNETVFNDSSISSLSLTFDTNAQKSLVMYSDGGTSGDGKGVILIPAGSSTTNLTTENYIGLAVAGISSGSTGSITIPGGISSGHSGLTTGRTYYVQPGGDLQLSAGNPSVVAGTSISDTEILVR